MAFDRNSNRNRNNQTKKGRPNGTRRKPKSTRKPRRK